MNLPLNLWNTLPKVVTVGVLCLALKNFEGKVEEK